jgi:ABC-2 type transport system permease protein
LFGEIISAGGFFFFVMAVSWVFGREFTDGTLKDMLAVPVQRSSILLAKFIVVVTWCAVMAIFIFIFGLVIAALIQLPGGSIGVILHGCIVTGITVCLIIADILPFAFFASVGRGYLLPMGVAVLTLIMANLMMVVGWGEYFPWAIPLLFSQGESSLTPISYWIVSFTCLTGMIATYLWWMYADQNR